MMLENLFNKSPFDIFQENTGCDENLAKLSEVVGHWFQCPTTLLTRISVQAQISVQGEILTKIE